MGSEILGIIIMTIGAYFLGMLQSYRYWNKYQLDSKRKLIPAEAGLVLFMLIGYPFFWNEIKIIIDSADRG